MKKIINFAIIGLINLVIFNVVILAETKAEKQPLFLKSNIKLSKSSDITEKDVKLMWEKVQLGIQLINSYWAETFKASGIRYTTPAVKYYTSPVNTNCGKLPMNNAVYCGADHTIYFDAIFFVRMMKGVGEQLGTDGDMAVIFVLAHEWGHAVQRMTGNTSKISIMNEENADCVAGAFTRYSSIKGWLEDGDVQEALTVLQAFGDELPWGANGTHGTPDERIAKFKRGFKLGLSSCQ